MATQFLPDYRSIRNATLIGLMLLLINCERPINIDLNNYIDNFVILEGINHILEGPIEIKTIDDTVFYIAYDYIENQVLFIPIEPIGIISKIQIDNPNYRVFDLETTDSIVIYSDSRTIRFASIKTKKETGEINISDFDERGTSIQKRTSINYDNIFEIIDQRFIVFPTITTPLQNICDSFSIFKLSNYPYKIKYYKGLPIRPLTKSKYGELNRPRFSLKPDTIVWKYPYSNNLYSICLSNGKYQKNNTKRIASCVNNMPGESLERIVYNYIFNNQSIELTFDDRNSRCFEPVSVLKKGKKNHEVNTELPIEFLIHEYSNTYEYQRSFKIPKNWYYRSVFHNGNLYMQRRTTDNKKIEIVRITLD